jgi:hypothetical protein
MLIVRDRGCRIPPGSGERELILYLALPVLEDHVRGTMNILVHLSPSHFEFFFACMYLWYVLYVYTSGMDNVPLNEYFCLLIREPWTIATI